MPEQSNFFHKHAKSIVLVGNAAYGLAFLLALLINSQMRFNNDAAGNALSSGLLLLWNLAFFSISTLVLLIINRSLRKQIALQSKWIRWLMALPILLPLGYIAYIAVQMTLFQLDTEKYAKIQKLKERGEKGVPGLILALKSKDDDVRYYASAALYELGGKARKAIPTLKRARSDKVTWVRVYAVKSLHKLGVNTDKDLPILIQALTDKNEYIRRDVAKTLGAMGTKASEAIDALTRALKDKDAQTREAAEGALANIRKAQKELVIQRPKHKDANKVRTPASEAPGKAGSKKTVPVPKQGHKDVRKAPKYGTHPSKL